MRPFGVDGLTRTQLLHICAIITRIECARINAVAVCCDVQSCHDLLLFVTRSCDVERDGRGSLVVLNVDVVNLDGCVRVAICESRGLENVDCQNASRQCCGRQRHAPYCCPRHFRELCRASPYVCGVCVRMYVYVYMVCSVESTSGKQCRYWSSCSSCGFPLPNQGYAYSSNPPMPCSFRFRFVSFSMGGIKVQTAVDMGDPSMTVFLRISSLIKGGYDCLGWLAETF